MKLPTILGAILLFGALSARADHNPDFDQDAKPILRMQPHLLAYVEHNFDVRDTGLAKVPGDNTRRPMPPFIFQARPRGSDGAYFITLLIQPGPEGRILKVVDPTRTGGRAPGPSAPPQEEAPPENQAPARQPPPEEQNPAPSAPSSSTPSGPTSGTPSGPLHSDSGSSTPLPPAPTNSPNLTPPPDPAPSAQ